MTYETALENASNADDFKLRMQGIASTADISRQSMQSAGFGGNIIASHELTKTLHSVNVNSFLNVTCGPGLIPFLLTRKLRYRYRMPFPRPKKGRIPKMSYMNMPLEPWHGACVQSRN